MIEKPYLKKEILVDINKRLNELKNIKEKEVKSETKKEIIGIENSDSDNEIKRINDIKKVVEPEKITNEIKRISNIKKVDEPEKITNEIKKIDDIKNVNDLKKITVIKKVEMKPESKIDDDKLIINNKDNKSNIDNNKPVVTKKVKSIMSEDELREIRNVSRKAEYQEFKERDQMMENLRKTVQDLEESKKEINFLKSQLNENNEDLKGELKNKFSDLANRFDEKISNIDGKIENKFSGIDNRFDKFDEKTFNIDAKLNESCTGIECLKKEINKRLELAECPECHKISVPVKSSFCPECGTKINEWTDDDGNILKEWKPNWKK